MTTDPPLTMDALRNPGAEGLQADPPVKLGVIGHPIAHSLSPAMHDAALRQAGIACRYGRFDITPDDLPEALSRMRDLGFHGVNVTIPHKTEAARIVDETTPEARRMNAVNTIAFDPSGTLGFNTDGPGLVRAIREEFLVDVRDLRVMVLGAGGGAGRAIGVQCALERCQRLVLANRTFDKAEALRHEILPDFESDLLEGPGESLVALPMDREALEREIPHVDLIINATSVGMKRTDPSPIPAALLSAYHMVYDTVYSHGRTKLVEDATSVGARAANGLSLLLHQGALAFEIWFDRPPDLPSMRRAIAST